jgi:hypothetical protein
MFTKYIHKTKLYYIKKIYITNPYIDNKQIYILRHVKITQIRVAKLVIMYVETFKTDVPIRAQKHYLSDSRQAL